LHKGFLYGLLLGLMMIWGFNVIAIKVLVEHFSAVTITAFRIFTAGVVVIAFLIAKKEFRKINLKEAFFIVCIALTGVLGHHTFLALGLSETTASNTGLILGLVPLTTAVFAMLFLGDKLTVLRMIGIISGLAGVSFIVLNGRGGLGAASIGDLFVFFAVISQAISFIFIKKAAKTVDSRLITGIMLVVGSLFLFLLGRQLEPRGLETFGGTPAWVWLVFLASAVLATGLGHMLYNRAIHRLGAGETAIFINLTPFFALTGSYFFLGETIELAQIFGFIFIVVGVLLGTGALERKDHFEQVKAASKGERG
jgi:drug/metabolite transporter (DMT)-like permease